MTAASDQSTAPRRKWTSGKLNLLRDMAATGKTQAEAAGLFGVSPKTIACIASRYKIRFRQRNIVPPVTGDFAEAVRPMMDADREPLRLRWTAEMPRLRERVRAEVAAIMAEAAQ